MAPGRGARRLDPRGQVEASPRGKETHMSKFQGIIVPMVTPFNRDEAQTINYEAGEKLVEKLIAGGASGIFTFGSNGEFHVCTPDEKSDAA